MDNQERFGDDIYFYLKDEEYGWMSNFYTSEIKINGRKYPSVEHYYQSRKSDIGSIQNWIASAPKPYLAMRAGRILREKDGFNKEQWEKDKFVVMYEGLDAKFRQHPDLGQKLLDTGKRKIHEASPTDKVWGFTGNDYLGKLLMLLRDNLFKNPGGGWYNTI